MKSTLAMGWMALIMSLLIAGCAAYFSISGLAVLFAAALIPVIVMATTLELGKLGATFFLHRYWDELPWKIKHPMAVMVFILMLITSMGIFGFLSKGHIEQEAPTVELSIDIQSADQEIAQHKDRINTLQAQLDQLNSSLAKLIEYAKVSGKDGYLIRQKELQPQMDALQAGIEQEKVNVRKIRETKAIAQREVSTIEAKLGPIKYVAELFGYDLKQDPDGKGKAVRIVIVLFMLAFDPFAIFLIMAADWTFIKYRKERLAVKVEEDETELQALRKQQTDLLDLQLQNEDLKTTISSHLQEDANIDEQLHKELTEVYETYEEILERKNSEISTLNEMIDSANVVEHVVFREIEVPVEIAINTDNAEHIHDLEHALIVLEIKLEEKTMELEEFMKVLAELDSNLDAKPTEVEKIVEVENTDRVDKLEQDKLALKSTITDAEDKIADLTNQSELKDIDLGRAVETIEERNGEIAELQRLIDGLTADINTARNDIESRDKAVESLNTKYQLIERVPGIGIVADNMAATQGATSFGTEFPVNPTPDQMFLRVDSMPSKLYTYEGTRWIESTKSNDTEYDEQYLQHLINELGEDRVSLDELSEKEQVEIQSLLSKEDVLGK